MRTIVLTQLFLLCSSLHATGQAGKTAVDVPVIDIGKGHRLIGKLHVPLGDVVRVQGVIVEGAEKGFEGGTNFRVQRISGKAIQEDIQIPLVNSTGVVEPDELSKVKLLLGGTYELQGYESGGYVGHPTGIWKANESDPGPARPWVQTVRHYFLLQFHYVRGKAIAPIAFSPADFEGRRALLQGIARDLNGAAVVEGESWQVIVQPHASWTKDWVGKAVETLGMYNPQELNTDPKSIRKYTLVDGTCRLTKLDDQVGQRVELRGTARSLNDHWWFEYRGIKLYVENLEELSGWTRDNWGKPVLIRGKLDRAMLPSLEQISLKRNRDLQDQFIVREASWAPLDALLAPERASRD